ncbi:MAG TPA: AsmA family protein, partial [Thermopetrobacter sp.]|nr:AsmA family protein [Thermopetrobacter sp.]
MSAWRSPLLYFGIAIIVLVAAALVAPHLVDWNRYRPQIAAWGTRLTGREVTIRGDVSVTLFPWPTLVLRGVSVANPPGARQPALLEAEAITARLSLAALVSGRLEVEKVDFRRPVVSLERLADGTGTWRLRPAARVHLPFTPERIAIAGITIEDGTVLLVDARRGGEARLTAIDAHISAPRLIGPWKLRADAELQGVPVNILITTGRIAAGGPVRVSARLAPREGGGFVYAFDGTLRDPRPGRLRGRLRIRPQPAKGKENMAEGLALYTFRADVLADFDEVWLKNLEAAPLAATRSANTVKGEAHILLGGILEAEATLKAGRFDLDWLLGDDARRLFGVRGLRAVADLAAALPPDVLLRLDLSASSLTAGGETLQGVHLSLDASAEQLAVNAFSTTLPGGSRLAFTGQLLPAETPQLSGAVEFESRALRDFVLWAAPARADAVSRLWTGARGRLVLDARLDATAERLRLFDGNFRLDDAGGRVELFLAPARLRANVRADALNVDRYAPSGLAAGGDGAAPARALLEIIAAAMGFGDVDVDL